MNTQYKLSNELEKWAWLKHHLEAESFDAVALMSALESETEIPECLLEIGEEALALEALAVAARERAKQIQARAARLEDKADRLRRVISATMINTQIDKPIQGPTMTLSLRKGQRDLVIMDESKIPLTFYDDAQPKLNKRRVRDALDRGEAVEGAQLGNGGSSVTIRAA
jgi:hypothetical protein